MTVAAPIPPNLPSLRPGAASGQPSGASRAPDAFSEPPGLPLAAVRFIADMGLFAVLSVSLVRRRPFSLEYASPEGWSPGLFLKTNYAISCVWLAAFLISAVAHLVRGRGVRF